jgi:hypothetical protein
MFFNKIISVRKKKGLKEINIFALDVLLKKLNLFMSILDCKKLETIILTKA